MPSINRPSWRGVSTTQEESTLNFLSESLRHLQRSTFLLRENVTNLVTPESSNEDEIPSDTEIIQISQEVNEIIVINEKLKNQVEMTIKENQDFKDGVKIYMKQHENWKQAFDEDSKRIDAELESVLCDHSKEISEISNEIKTNSVRQNSEEEISKSAFNRVKTWCTLAGAFGRDAYASIKRKLLSIAMPENIFTTNSFGGGENPYFDYGLTGH